MKMVILLNSDFQIIFMIVSLTLIKQISENRELISNFWCLKLIIWPEFSDGTPPLVDATVIAVINVDISFRHHSAQMFIIK